MLNHNEELTNVIHKIIVCITASAHEVRYLYMKVDQKGEVIALVSDNLA